ncbi:MAG: phosphoribosyltransferase domain-containing protein [Lachnospiraceae bacterium]
MYTENDLVRLAKRENNNKRGYLVVNRLQGKHIPVVPSEALNMFLKLGSLIKKQYPDEKLLLIGFAETATAIGAALAVYLKCDYIQTTRELIRDVEYFYFSEAHSHATEQKLVKDDIDQAVNTIDRILFIEDEVTTGNTILNIVDLMRAEYSDRIEFGVASLLNGMNEQALGIYHEKRIATLYLLKTNHETYDERVAGVPANGTYIKTEAGGSDTVCQELQFGQYLNARRLVGGEDYDCACEGLWGQMNAVLNQDKNQRLLVLGTEEFMYPALYVAWKLEMQHKQVRFHATTRSPIAVSLQDSYPLHTRYEGKSLYDKDRTTFLYDLSCYDQVLLITDANNGQTEGMNSVIQALAESQNKSITVIRWCDDEKFL